MLTEKLVFQGDLLRLPADGKYAPDAVDDATIQFYDQVARLGLTIERVAGVHGPVTSMADLRAAVEKKRKGR
ncbi:MAG TPA: hypothetical protein VFS00_06005 [Polyangiaceae bacterium]|nr:hypothetical protein [Polyangiaceae bacterium]